MADSKLSVTHPAGHILTEVGRSMQNQRSDMTVSLPVDTTWRECLDVVSSAMGDRDKNIHIFPPVSAARRQALRKEALQKSQAPASASASNLNPIRTKYDIMTTPSPRPISAKARQRAKEKIPPSFQEPYPATVRATVIDRVLPAVTSNLRIEGIDDGTVYEDITSVMLFDSGAQQTLITDDILSAEFTQYLRVDPINEPYRLDNSTCHVQVSANINFTNTYISLAMVALVIPKEKIPNNRSGVIFGQSGCIDAICFQSRPARFLRAQGEDIGPGIWGDLTVTEYENEDGDLVQC